MKNNTDADASSANVSSANHEKNTAIEENVVLNTTLVIEKKKRGRKKLIKEVKDEVLNNDGNSECTTSIHNIHNIHNNATTSSNSDNFAENGKEKKQRKNRVLKKKDQNIENLHEIFESNELSTTATTTATTATTATTTTTATTATTTATTATTTATTATTLVHKKRGRKPRGGKIINENQMHANNAPEVPNIILHLKCVLSDLKKSNELNSNKVDTYSNDKKLEILCYNDNDQNTAFSSNGSNVTKYENECVNSANVSDFNKNKFKEVQQQQKKEESATNSSHTSQVYDPLTFSSNSAHPIQIPFITETNAKVTPFSLYEKQLDGGELDCKNATNKEIWKKISQLKLNFHRNDGLSMQRSSCFWDTCEFDTPPIHIPLSSSKGYGCFCHPECAVAYLMNENIDTSVKFERYYLLNSIYGPIYNYNKSIKPATNPHYLLNKFYGNLTINEYRKLFQCEQVVYMVNKPLTNILPELYEDNNDFFIGSKIVQNSTIEIRKKITKNAKSSIINEAFGIK
jgi:hypothetical protein